MPPPSPGEITAMQNQTQKEMTDKEKLAAVLDLSYEMEGLLCSMDTTKRLLALTSSDYGFQKLEKWKYAEIYENTTVYLNALADRIENELNMAEGLFNRLCRLVGYGEDGSK